MAHKEVQYEIVFPTRMITVTRKWVATTTLKFDRQNPRIQQSLKSQEGRITQKVLRDIMMLEDGMELVEALGENGGHREPLLINAHDTTLEGNRRLAASLHRLEVLKDERFAEIPCEQLPSDVTEAEIRSYLSLRHIRQQKKWPSPEIAAQLKLMVEQDGWEIGSLSKYLGESVQWINRYVKAGELCNEFFNYARSRSANKRDTDESKKDPAQTFTYFWKLAQKPKMKGNLEDGQWLDMFYGWLYDGKLNDCTDLGHFEAVLNDPAAMKVMKSKNGDYKEALETLTQSKKARRASNTVRTIQIATNSIRRIPSVQLQTLDRNKELQRALRELHIVVEKAMEKAGLLETV